MSLHHHKSPTTLCFVTIATDHSGLHELLDIGYPAPSTVTDTVDPAAANLLRSSFFLSSTADCTHPFWTINCTPSIAKCFFIIQIIKPWSFASFGELLSNYSLIWPNKFWLNVFPHKFSLPILPSTLLPYSHARLTDSPPRTLPPPTPLAPHERHAFATANSHIKKSPPSSPEPQLHHLHLADLTSTGNVTL